MTRLDMTGAKMRHFSRADLAGLADRVRGSGLARATARSVMLGALLGLAGCGSFSSLSQTEPDPSLKLAGIFLKAGAPDAALRAVDEVLARQPRNVEAMQSRADALSQLGRSDEAQQAYATLIAANPTAIGPRIALGRMLVPVDPAAAEQVFTALLARQPGNAIALNNLGIARDLQGRHIEAQAAYRAARAADPKMTGASVNMGLSQVLAGDMAEAVRTLTPLASLPDAPDAVHENLGVALAISGDSAGAARVLGRVMSAAEANEALAQYRHAAGPLQVAVVQPPAAPRPVVPAAVAVVAALGPVATAPVAATPVAERRTAPPAPLASIAVPAALIERAAPDPAPVTAYTALPVRPASMPRPMPAPMPIVVPITVPITVPIAPASAQPRVADAALRPSGAVYAQLAMSPSAGRARARWDEIRSSQPELMGDRPLVIAASSYRDQPLWAVRTGPFASARQAEIFCQRLLGVGQDCWAMVPSPDLVSAGATPIATSAPSAARVDPVAGLIPPAAIAAAHLAVVPIAPAALAAELPAGAPSSSYAQLAASDSAAAVPGEWQRLRNRLGPLLRDRPEMTVSAEVGGRTVWRLRTGPFQQPREAAAFCAEVRAAGGGCWTAGS